MLPLLLSVILARRKTCSEIQASPRLLLNGSWQQWKWSSGLQTLGKQKHLAWKVVDFKSHFNKIMTNFWFCFRFIPLNSFSTASWTVAHELKVGSPHGKLKNEGEFYLGGNVKCPHLIHQIFYSDGNEKGSYSNSTDIKLTCLNRRDFMASVDVKEGQSWIFHKTANQK